MKDDSHGKIREPDKSGHFDRVRKEGTPINQPCLIVTGFDGAKPFIRVNGIDQGIAANDIRAFKSDYITLGAWYLFGSSPVDNWVGPLSDIAVADYQVTGDELLRAEASWLWDRNLSALIPAASPYKAARPMVGGGTGPIMRRRTVIMV